MRLESRAPEFLAAVGREVRQAREDVVTLAKHNLGGSGQLTNSVHAVHEAGGLKGRVGSDHDGAKAQETGAFIRPIPGRRGRKGHAPAISYEGKARAWARIPPKRWLSRAGREWRAVVEARLRRVGL